MMNSWVENQTGLEGNYDIQFSWPIGIGANPGSEGVPPDPTFIFAALQNELGLKLEQVKGPVPVFVVQRAEMPTAKNRIGVPAGCTGVRAPRNGS